MSNEDGSGPAFPGNPSKDVFTNLGMSQRAYAAIHLRVTDPALPEWLNAMIERARREEFAKASINGLLSNEAATNHPHDQLARFAYMQADAMLAQGRKG